MVQEYFTQDHRRLESLLHRAIDASALVDEAAYVEFRIGLLKHIALEEKILIPALSKSDKYPLASQLRLEHGAIAALLVLPPSVEIKNALLGILRSHNKCEESEAGLYKDCDTLLEISLDTIMQMIKTYPNVPVMPYNNSQMAHDAVRRAVSRAGFDFDALVHNSHS